MVENLLFFSIVEIISIVSFYTPPSFCFYLDHDQTMNDQMLIAA